MLTAASRFAAFLQSSTHKEIGTTILAQIIEVQVLLRTKIDLQKLAITSSQQSDPTELDSRCQAQIGISLSASLPRNCYCRK